MLFTVITTTGLYSPLWFWVQQRSWKWIVAWLFLYYLFISLKRSIVLSLITLYLYINASFPIETTIRNASKVGKPGRKPYHPYSFRNLTKKLISEENSSLFIIAFCRKAKTKVETTRLENLNIFPRNLNEDLLSWIQSHGAGAVSRVRIESETYMSRRKSKIGYSFYTWSTVSLVNKVSWPTKFFHFGCERYSACLIK